MDHHDTSITNFASSTGCEPEQTPNNESEPSKHKVNQSGNNEYGTDPSLIRLLHDAVGGLFDIDVASGAEPFPIGDVRWTKEDDAFTKDWTSADESLFMNPPFSDPEKWFRRFVEAIDQNDPGKPDYGVAISNTNLSAGWAQEYVLKHATAIAIPPSRIEYYGAGSEVSFCSIISFFGEPPRSLLNAMKDYKKEEGGCKLLTPVEFSEVYEQESLDDIFSDGGAVAALPLQSRSPTATPHQASSLDVLHAHDHLKIEFSTDTPVSQHQRIPDSVRVEVLPQGKEIKPATGEIQIDTIGKTPSGEEVCVMIENSPGVISGVDVYIAVEMGDWVQASVDSITQSQREQTHSYFVEAQTPTNAPQIA